VRVRIRVRFRVRVRPFSRSREVRFWTRPGYGQVQGCILQPYCENSYNFSILHCADAEWVWQ